MSRDLERRLASAEISAATISSAERRAADHRRSLRALVALVELVRERLGVMGIDPALAETLRRGEEAAAELAVIPDTRELKAADEAIVCPESNNGDDGARQVWAKIARMAEQYRDGQHRLDLANASPGELLAFCDAFEMGRRDEVPGVGRLRPALPIANAAAKRDDPSLPVCSSRA